MFNSFKKLKMNKLSTYGYEPDNIHFKDERVVNESENQIDLIEVEKFKGDEFDDDEFDEFKLYDNNLTFAENFEDGEEVKYILVPIYKNPKNDYDDFTPLLNAGAKVIMNRKDILEDYSENLNYLVLDYDSIFGLRLLSFQRYKANFFTCDERVFFETLIIKFKRFNYQSFYYSYPKIFEEIGIKKDKASSIVKKFTKLGILDSEIKTSYIDGRPSQITYYNLNPQKIIDLCQSIFKEIYVNEITEKLETYLKPSLNRKIDVDTSYKDIRNIMQ